MINQHSEGEPFTKVDTNWAITGDNIKVITHGLHLVMMTDKELCVYDPITKRVLQLYENKGDATGKYFALGGCQGLVCSIYNPNSAKKGSKFLIELHKEIEFEL